MIAKIVGMNTKRHDMFEDKVNMYTYEELVNGRKLTEIINNDHENIKYLPGYKLPENVVSIFQRLKNLFLPRNSRRSCLNFPRKFFDLMFSLCKPITNIKQKLVLDPLNEKHYLVTQSKTAK